MNVNAAERVGGMPFIAFKSNTFILAFKSNTFILLF